MAKTKAVCNQKGGVNKTTVAVNLCAGLARKGKKVLAVDLDAQADLTAALGFRNCDGLSDSMGSFLQRTIRGENPSLDFGILSHFEGFKLLPANIELAGLEMVLISASNRETVLRRCLDTIKSRFDYIIIDCAPSLSMLTINALAAADSVIIPVQAQYLPLKGMTQLVETIGNVQRSINPGLKIDGAILTLVEPTIFAREAETTLRTQYGNVLKVYNTQIPRGTKAAETSAVGESIFTYSPRSKVGLAYADFVDEVLAGEEEV